MGSCQELAGLTAGKSYDSFYTERRVHSLHSFLSCYLMSKSIISPGPYLMDSSIISFK